MATPTLGRIVLYTLSDLDAEAINRRRDDAIQHLAEHRDRADGSVIHVGNMASEGDIYPLVVTRVWGSTPESAINGQVLLDGNDTFWATSITHGTGPRTWTWPPRV